MNAILDTCREMSPLWWEYVWHVTWQASLLALFMVGLTSCFWRLPSAWRYSLLLLALAKFALPPLWSSPSGVFSLLASSVELASSRRQVAVLPAVSINSGTARNPRSTSNDRPEILLDVSPPALESTIAANSPGTSMPLASAATPTTVSSTSAISIAKLDWKTSLMLTYFAGCLVCALGVVIAALRVQRLLKRAEPLVSGPWQRRLDALAHRLGVRRHVRLFVTAQNVSPLATGVLRPMIVLPRAALAGLSHDDIETVLAHELAHHRRGDLQITWLQLLLTVVWWFNPIIWLLNRIVHSTREECCDDLLLASQVANPGSYCETLVRAASSLSPRVPGGTAIGFARHLHPLASRIARIMDGTLRRPQRLSLSWLIVLVLVGAATLPGVRARALDDQSTTPAVTPATPEDTTKAGESSATSRDSAAEVPADARAAAGVGARSPADDSESADATKTSPAAPEEATISAAALVQAVYDSQAWIDSAHTFRVRTRCKITNTEEARRWEAEHPDRRPFAPAGKVDPRPFCLDTDWAWTESQIRHQTESHHEGDGNVNAQTKVWDGSLAVEYLTSPTSEQYVFGNKPEKFFGHFAARAWSLPWGSPRGHHFWWLGVDAAEPVTMDFKAPEDFERLGEEEVHGRRCQVVESRAAHYRLHIGVADGRLYRRTLSVVSQKADGYDHLALLRQVGGPTIKTPSHWQAWLDRLDAAERLRAWRDLAIAEHEFTRVWVCETLDDYRELAPGRWMAFTRSNDSHNVHVPEPFLASHSDETIIEASVDQPLDDALFKIELKDGVRVATDWRYDPIIRYTYSKDQTEAERVALAHEARLEQAKTEEEMKRRQAPIEARVGQPPLPLPTAGWLAGGPLTWQQLHGKVVVLHFWDVNCGPCQNDLPFLVGWHENSAKSGIVVIGVHRPTDDLAAVRKKMADFDIKYPILIDSPPEKSGGIGGLHDWFGISYWPNGLAISKRGLVAGHGQVWLGDLSKLTVKLAGEDVEDSAAPDDAKIEGAQAFERLQATWAQHSAAIHQARIRFRVLNLAKGDSRYSMVPEDLSAKWHPLLAKTSADVKLALDSVDLIGQPKALHQLRQSLVEGRLISDAKGYQTLTLTIDGRKYREDWDGGCSNVCNGINTVKLDPANRQANIFRYSSQSWLVHHLLTVPSLSGEIQFNTATRETLEGSTRYLFGPLGKNGQPFQEAIIDNNGLLRRFRKYERLDGDWLDYEYRFDGYREYDGGVVYPTVRITASYVAVPDGTLRDLTVFVVEHAEFNQPVEAETFLAAVPANTAVWDHRRGQTTLRAALEPTDNVLALFKDEREGQGRP